MAPKAPAPSAAPVEPQYVEVTLPAGMTYEQLAHLPSPAEGEEAEPAEETPPALAPVRKPHATAPKRPSVAPVAPVEEPPAEPPAEPARRPATDATRQARVPLPEVLRDREKLRRAREDVGRLEAENRVLRQKAAQEAVVRNAQIDPLQITDQDRQTLTRIAQEEAAKESDLGKVLAATQARSTEYLFGRFNGVRQAEQNRRTVSNETQRIRDSERVFKEQLRRDKAKYSYDYVCREGGIFDAFETDQSGAFAEPATVADIRSAPDPAKRAYEIGLIRLQEWGVIPPAEEDEGPDDQPDAASAASEQNGHAGRPAAPDAASTPRARRASADEIAAAERRGEQRGAAAIVDQSVQRGRGIKHLPSAPGAPGRAAVTKAFLDNLQKTNPDQWLQILEANEELNYQYMSGDLA